MFGLGFFSRHTNEKGLLIGVAAGFVALAHVEYALDVAWPWYCALGGIISIAVGWTASILLGGFRDEYHPYTVKGQLRRYEQEGLPMMEGGWYVVAGKIDRASYPLLGFFVLCVLGLWITESLI